ncbi:ParA family protein [Aestuariirhabdus litorea]|uniref:ParA family protein n=1 Tax=Aestuariirhabdus litorea TaxID=2528527 RepID=A0A3P3VL70_9GAMM|nr:ParA family protein [Aestuariirhabdus litorea]RRJ82466.1 ParA family protein [Aestuariirhabdus litorea]RWW92627.1 ParA family protein [Endozoicomonadaceae bacterium GTF-13]
MQSYKLHPPLRLLIANAKGGSGKTTIATNLAAYFALQQESIVLYDHDPQGSSQRWLKQRPPELPAIRGIDACQPHSLNQTRSWQLRLPDDCRMVIMDSPAAIRLAELRPLVRQADLILVPVLPSAIDIRAAADFIKSLMLTPEHLQRPGRICVVGNRVRRNTLSQEKLKAFLNCLSIPFLTTLRDTQNYLAAAEQGRGLHELKGRKTQRDLQEWQPLIDWINHLGHSRQRAV